MKFSKIAAPALGLSLLLLARRFCQDAIKIGVIQPLTGWGPTPGSGFMWR